MSKTLYVITSNFRLYFLINKDFQTKGYKVIHFFPSQVRDSSIDFTDGVIITTPSERFLLPFSQVLEISPSRYSISRLLSLLSLEHKSSFVHEVVVIGVDPGSSLGLSVRAGGDILFEGVFSSIDGFIHGLLKILTEIHSFHYVIRLGNGNLDQVLLILNRLIPVIRVEMTFELVNEFGSTRVVRKIKNKKIDSLSAREISYRSGIVINIKNKGLVSRSDLPVV